MEKENLQRTRVLFYIGAAVLLVLRLALVERLPAYIVGNAPHDDLWMVQKASYILAGQWMGPYDQYTLIKGAFSPLFLAACRGLGLSFMETNTVLYCAASLIFVVALQPVLKKVGRAYFALR